MNYIKMRTLSVILCGLGLVLISNTQIHAQDSANLLSNPSFEEDVVPFDGLGWERRGGPTDVILEPITDPVQDGSLALLVNGDRSNLWNGVQQWVTLEAGVTYVISGHVRLPEGNADDTIVLQLIKKFADKGNVFQKLTEGSITATEYREFKALFSFGESDTTETILSIHGASVGTPFIVDNFSITEATTPDTIVNGSFEEPINLDDGFDWDRRGGNVTVTQVESPVLDGAYAVLVSGRDPQFNWHGIKQTIKLDPGTHYRFQGAMRLENGVAADVGAVQIGKELEDGTTQFDTVFNGDISDAEYTEFDSAYVYTDENVVSTFISIHGPAEGKSFIADAFTMGTIQVSPLWTDFTVYPSGWMNGWIGWIVDMSGSWIYHFELGYLYVLGETGDSVWLYDYMGDDWIWTSQDVYPQLHYSKTGWTD